MVMGEPLPHAPTVPQRWEYLKNVIQLCFNQAMNTGVNWALSSTSFTVEPYVDIYTLTCNDFGKDVLIETYDPDDQNHISRPVVQDSFQSLLNNGAPNYMSGVSYHPNGLKHSARAMAIFRQDGQVKLRVVPTPSTEAQYRVWYEVQNANTDAIENSFVIGAAEPYIVSATALSLLPLCKWPDMNDEQNALRRKDMLTVLSPYVAEQKRIWQHYAATDKQAGRIAMMGFHDDLMEIEL